MNRSIYKRKSYGDGVDISIKNIPKNIRIGVDFYESEGGVVQKVNSVFISETRPKKLFVIVSWNGDVSDLGTGGEIYQVFAYDELVERNGGKLILRKDVNLTKRFGTGFDGVQEGKCLIYKYKTMESVRRQLLEWGFH